MNENTIGFSLWFDIRPPKISLKVSAIGKGRRTRRNTKKSMPKSKWKFRDFFRYCNVEGKRDNWELSKHYIFNWKKKSLYLPSMTRSCCILFVSLWNRGSTSNVTERRRSREKESLFLESTSFISLCAKINSFVKMSWNRKLIETLRRTWWETFYHAEVYKLSILVSSIISI